MKHTITVLALTLLALPAFADNYATCLLEKMPELQNEPAAYAAAQVCVTKYPDRMNAIVQGSGRSFWSYESGAECALEKSASTQSRTAAYQIRVACNRLYDKPRDLIDEFMPVSVEQSER
ncbi:hypothetical protein [Stutzerimonas stutzeri]|uniref:DUF1311 domain-containing protein n=1 Tax=Stutzerimonas stutzeri TaxID=316 RepID=A0A5S5BI34_STUST|nr:hypothetical protein [Stutzerimonas stutzeri]TYP65363.1 hypothetical protein A9A72_122491 [Stutzerimonas stutzeri]